ncbi:MAG TPA: hypothetical protein VKQ52_04875 [Puia sp.]|nr:hypothetical protein [Puia sp.]
MQETKDHIKTRLLKNAARAWGLPETEAEANFDPLVSMLFSACAAELEKISGEIQNSRARILERMVQLLSPDSLTGALPAHAIASTTPIERHMELPENTQFFLSRRQQGQSEMEDTAPKDIFFSPTAPFPLTRAAVRYMAVGNTLYQVKNTINKEVIAIAEPDQELPASSLWLGIDEPGTPLGDTLFYFDIRNDAARQLFYNQLPKATWYWSDQPMAHIPGYGNRNISGEQIDLETTLNRDDDTSGKIAKRVNALYKPSFITLVDPEGLSAGEDNTLLASMIEEVFPGKVLKQVQKTPLRWICIDFPQAVSSRVLQDVLCVMNCFPVVNRRLHEFTFRVQDIINIVPLQSEDTFLDLAEAGDDEGHLLNIRSFDSYSDDSFALLLRNGGVGRFDGRDAGAIVDYLLQLLRDESAAFSTLGSDFVNGELKQLRQIINKLEQRLYSRQQQRDETPYLVIRNNNKNPWQNIFIRHWSTCGTGGNNIRSGSVMRLYKGGGLQNSQLTLVTTTVGGRDRLSVTDRVMAYKSALLSRDRIITSEDIKVFCQYQLGQCVRKIDVKKGVQSFPDQQQGFTRTIDVFVDIEPRVYDDMLQRGEIAFWKDNLKLLLEERSAGLTPFRVFLGEAS